jgi:hypothetical protein
VRAGVVQPPFSTRTLAPGSGLLPGALPSGTAAKVDGEMNTTTGRHGTFTPSSGTNGALCGGEWKWMVRLLCPQALIGL